MCVRTCTPACICVWTCILACACMFACVWMCTLARMCVWTFTLACMYVCYVHTCMYVCMCMCTLACIYVFVCAHLHVHVCMCLPLMYLQEPEEDIKFPGTGVARQLWAVKPKGWELDCGYLEKQRVLLRAEPSLQPRLFIYNHLNLRLITYGYFYVCGCFSTEALIISC